MHNFRKNSFGFRSMSDASRVSPTSAALGTQIALLAELVRLASVSGVRIEHRTAAENSYLIAISDRR